MTDIGENVEQLFRKMLDSIDILKTEDAILKKDMEDFKLKIQWVIDGITGYQIFDNGKYRENTRRCFLYHLSSPNQEQILAPMLSTRRMKNTTTSKVNSI